MSNVLDLLYETRPLIVNPQLAVEIGLNEALILQQIKYWHERATYRYDGEPWFYKTNEDWEAEFPFFSDRTIRRGLKSLGDLGAIKTRRDLDSKVLNKRGSTLWYALNLDVDKLASSKFEVDKMASSDLDRLASSDLAKMATSSIQRLDTETTTETTTPIVPNGDKPEVEILNHLNAKRKALFDSLGFRSKTINAIASNLKPIKARLRNYTADEIKTVIDHLIVSWGNDAGMRQYLTPASIFRSSKFDGKNIAAQEWKLNGSAVGFGRTLNKQEALEAKNSEAGKAFLRKLHGGSTYEHE